MPVVLTCDAKPLFCQVTSIPSAKDAFENSSLPKRGVTVPTAALQGQQTTGENEIMRC